MTVRFTDYILGEEVYDMTSKNERDEVVARAPFSLVLSYELQVRKKAAPASWRLTKHRAQPPHC